ncbi:hypothetical protein [Streptomyces nondiastaticus]|uniref:Uncharacterized protein n=1 Tax=Streptomyces nondiastaticus TaxID=3154512 RepID=A0ABW6TVH3_9ACTN
MRHFIRRWFRRERQISAPEPPPVPEPRAAEPEPRPSRGPTCGVYVWATAHGINLESRSPLGVCTCSERAHQPLPALGSFVVDKRDGSVGQVMRNGGGQVLLLRAPSGGGDWEADADMVRPATEAELLSAKVQAANAASRWGR